MFDMDYPAWFLLNAKTKAARIEGIKKYILDNTPSRYHSKLIPPHCATDSLSRTLIVVNIS